jgi:hypothetical protein
MGWETFDKRKARPADMTASIFKTKKLALSKAVIEALGTGYVEFLYDADTNRMALQPSSPDNPVAYRIRKSSKQESWGVSLIAFVNHYGLDDVIGKRYQVVEENDLFVIDLNKPISETRKGRVKKGT